MELSGEIRKQLLAAQRDEITGHYIYKRIAASLPESENRKVMDQIAEDELGHYKKWKSYTGVDISPNWIYVWGLSLISRVFGFTFGARLLEKGEASSQVNYAELSKSVPDSEKIRAEEEVHEEKLLGMLDEEVLHYASSVVLGLNDALVELTGALAGLTLALQDVKLIALSGIITGIAASLSMAASEYLSTSAEQTDKSPILAAAYTGIAYIFTVVLLILPYLLISNIYIALGVTLTVAVLIIAAFNFYISTARAESFRPRFLKMAGLSLGVSAISFIIGYFVRTWLGVNI